MIKNWEIIDCVHFCSDWLDLSISNDMAKALVELENDQKYNKICIAALQQVKLTDVLEVAKLVNAVFNLWECKEIDL